MEDNTSLFKIALQFILKWEGGYINDIDDAGGATNRGITQGTYNRWLASKGATSRDVKNITMQEVGQIYYQNYWIAAGCHKMSKVFAVLCFDTAVNMGLGRIHEFLEAAHYKEPDKFIFARIAKYRKIAEIPKKDKITGKIYYPNRKFLKGWLNRVNALREFIKTL